LPFIQLNISRGQYNSNLVFHKMLWKHIEKDNWIDYSCKNVGYDQNKNKKSHSNSVPWTDDIFMCVVCKGNRFHYNKIHIFL